MKRIKTTSPVDTPKEHLGYFDLKVGKVFVMPGSAKNEYKILEINKRETKMLRLKDNLESTLPTKSLLNILG
jgi:hypothetical protein